MAVLLVFFGIIYLMLENAGVLWRPPVVSAAKLDPQFFAAYSRLGFAYSKMGAFKKAIEFQKKAVEIGPHFAAGNIGRASSKVPLGWSGEQIQENKARKSLAEALTGLERMAYKRGQIDEEEKLCREYLKYFPESKVWREFLDDLLKRKK